MLVCNHCDVIIEPDCREMDITKCWYADLKIGNNSPKSEFAFSNWHSFIIQIIWFSFQKIN
jgi:hypothetical protein